MRKVIFIGIGGILGALLRYGMKGISLFGLQSVPLNILIINVTGAFILALIMTLLPNVKGIAEEIRSGVTVGVLGAYTTFSTLCRETVGLLQNSGYFSAGLYMFASITLGLGAAWLGAGLARRAGSKRRKEKH
jgi:CrcB protein